MKISFVLMLLFALTAGCGRSLPVANQSPLNQDSADKPAKPEESDAAKMRD